MSISRAVWGGNWSVPASAVLQSGTRQLAFIDQGGGRLVPQAVETGPRVGDDLVVLKGLRAGQRIVTSANFLIDSESQLQAAAGSYVPPPPGASAAATQPSQSAQLNIEFATDPAPPRKGNNTIRVKLTGSQRSRRFRRALHARHAGDGNGRRDHHSEA